jgi:peptidoglycan/LPS O-acetylase OafA/YrhL
MNAYQRISRYKSALMGIAILIVVYGHFFYYHSGLKDYTQLNITMWYTVGSVDIFVFLSGFGIYHSLKKNDNPLKFLQRRLGRLFPSYLPFIVVYCAFCLWAGTMTKWQALGNLTTFGWWSQMGGQFNWYIPTLIGMYLFSPLFFHIIETYGRRSLLMLPLFFLIEAACVGTSLMIGLSRFPVYFLGLYLGRESALGHSPSKRHLWLSGILAILSMVALYFLVTRHPNAMGYYGLWWHPYLLSTPGCLYFTTWCLEKHEKWAPTRLLNRGLSFLGGKSFEIYLVHILVYTVALYFGLSGWLPWVGMALLGLTLGCCYSVLVGKFTSGRKS